MEKTSSVTVQVMLEPPVIPFHKKSDLRLVIEYPESVTYTIPDIKRFIGDLSASEPILQSDKGYLTKGKKRDIIIWKIDAVHPGEYPIGPIEIQTSDGEISQSSELTLRVRDLTPEEEAAVQDFAPDAPVPIPKHVPIMWPLMSALAVSSLIFLYLYKKIKNQAAFAENAPQVPPWEKAYARLRELDQKRLPNLGEHDLFYVELSAILREYIEERFSIRAPELTTQEFLAEAAKTNALSVEQQRLVVRFLLQSDKVKFARHTPTLTEMRDAFAYVVHFVDETIPREIPAVEASATC